MNKYALFTSGIILFTSYSNWALNIPTCESPNVAYTVNFTRSQITGDQILEDLAVLGHSVHIAPEYPQVSTATVSVFISSNNPQYLDSDALREAVNSELQQFTYQKGVNIVCEDE